MSDQYDNENNVPVNPVSYNEKLRQLAGTRTDLQALKKELQALEAELLESAEFVQWQTLKADISELNTREKEQASQLREIAIFRWYKENPGDKNAFPAVTIQEAKAPGLRYDPIDALKFALESPALKLTMLDKEKFEIVARATPLDFVEYYPVYKVAIKSDLTEYAKFCGYCGDSQTPLHPDITGKVENICDACEIRIAVDDAKPEMGDA